MATIVGFARTAADRMKVTPDSDGRDDDALWASLMLRAQDGDRGAYHALLRAIAPYLRAIAQRYLGRGDDAEDAVQDVLLVMHGIRHTYERGRPFKPWLGTIASRRCIDLLRRRAYRLRHELDAMDDAELHADPGHDPETSMASADDAGLLHDAVAALPLRQREAIRLLRLSELTLQEASVRSEQSVGSLKVAVHRAFKSLQRTFAKERSRD